MTRILFPENRPIRVSRLFIIEERPFRLESAPGTGVGLSTPGAHSNSFDPLKA
jgi:hypothetical protein